MNVIARDKDMQDVEGYWMTIPTSTLSRFGSTSAISSPPVSCPTRLTISNSFCGGEIETTRSAPGPKYFRRWLTRLKIDAASPGATSLHDLAGCRYGTRGLSQYRARQSLG